MKSRVGVAASQWSYPSGIVVFMLLFRRCVQRAILVSLVAGSVGAVSAATATTDAAGILVLQTDFGLKDHAVAAMRGVIRNVDRRLVVDDLTHEIPAYNIWEAAYRLNAVIHYWPADTVFVSVVDPGVGTHRKSVVARLNNGQMFVTPDNGTLTLIADRLGLTAVREIDAHKHRLPGSADSYTFHGRDVYAYVGALLASGKLKFDDVGPPQSGIVRIDYEPARRSGDTFIGGIPALDTQYGNVWTNIPAAGLDALNVHIGDRVVLTISDGGAHHVALTVVYVRTFGDVPIGDPLLYVNSIGMLAVALNQKDFAATYGITSGPGWRVELTRAGTGSP